MPCFHALVKLHRHFSLIILFPYAICIFSKICYALEQRKTIIIIIWLKNSLICKLCNKREQPQGLLFHSDRGTQYTAFSFRKLLDSLNIVQSFSKKGYPFDNACCECFFKYLKKEETNRKTNHSLEELRLSIFDYIEGYYNSRRPHGSLAMLTPNQKEELFWNQV